MGYGSGHASRAEGAEVGGAAVTGAALASGFDHEGAGMASGFKAGAPVQKIFPGVAGGAAWVKVSEP